MRFDNCVKLITGVICPVRFPEVLVASMRKTSKSITMTLGWLAVIDQGRIERNDRAWKS